MNIYSSLRTALRNVALAALDEFPTAPVIFTHQNGTEPPDTYVTISILSATQQGHHSTSTLTDTQDKITIQAFYECFVQFSFTGSQSGDMAYSFNQRINNSPIVLEALARNKLGFMRKTSVRRSPQKRDTQWVEYHNMDITFNYNLVTDQVVDIVEAVVIETQIEDTPPNIFSVPEGIIYP